MLYAEDTIIFCETTTKRINYITVILVLFETVLGLKVIRGKRGIFLVLRSIISKIATTSKYIGSRVVCIMDSQEVEVDLRSTERGD